MRFFEEVITIQEKRVSFSWHPKDGFERCGYVGCNGTHSVYAHIETKERKEVERVPTLDDVMDFINLHLSGARCEELTKYPEYGFGFPTSFIYEMILQIKAAQA